ncbi:serine hydrolase domain-containing protein [Streptomyces sp. NPDC048172]|uniref:serine hydrolase domain-containing protein n=1 Tax=Streptomyces sp. NPDC048172 TaxID=3365505 RepID=UPI00371ADCED
MLVGAVVAGVFATALTGHAGAVASDAAAPGAAGEPQGAAAARDAMDTAVGGGVPGAIGRIEDARGTWRGTAGTGDLAKGTPRRADDRFRIGSVSKTFLATVVLQLEDEGRLSLGDTVEKWLPGLVTGNGNDGRRVTLRQLLQHTSGIYDFVYDPGFDAVYGTDAFLEHRYDRWKPEDVVAVAMKHRPEFEPGTSWKYSNTNYTLLAMIVDKAAGRPYEREIERRVIEPLSLRATSVPHTDPGLPAPHSRGYVRFTPDGELLDVTEMSPTWAKGSGAMISTTKDLARFYRALLGGRLLSGRQLAKMLDTVPTGDTKTPRVAYGLGVFVYKFSCGVTAWGHGGSVHGSSSFVGTTLGRKEFGGKELGGKAEGPARTMAFQYNVAGGGSAHTVADAAYCAKS